MNNGQQDKAMFVSFCIEQYAKAKNITTEDVVNLFEQYGISEHFCEFYDVLHTQGGQWLVEEIDKMISEKKMSKVYHGSVEEVRNPEIRQSNRSLDYGSGFYTTTSYEQAKKWVERRMKDKGESIGYVNVYELDDEVMEDMKSLFFEKPTEEWVNFVMKNRTERDFTHDYDVVYGPVADDSVYTQFTLYEAGIISMPTLIQELKTYKLVDQYLFHTEKSLQTIKFVESKMIKL